MKTAEAIRIYGITAEELKNLGEVYNEYAVSTKEKDCQSYKDWCVLYDGIYRESTYEVGFRNWLACTRWHKSQNLGESKQGWIDVERELLADLFTLANRAYVDHLSKSNRIAHSISEPERIRIKDIIEKTKKALSPLPSPPNKSEGEKK